MTKPRIQPARMLMVAALRWQRTGGRSDARRNRGGAQADSWARAARAAPRGWRGSGEAKPATPWARGARNERRERSAHDEPRLRGLATARPEADEVAPRRQRLPSEGQAMRAGAEPREVRTRDPAPLRV